jgi:hypothetical protein
LNERAADDISLVTKDTSDLKFHHSSKVSCQLLVSGMEIEGKVCIKGLKASVEYCTTPCYR